MKFRCVSTLFIISIFRLEQSSTSLNKTPLYVGVLLPKTDHWFAKYANFIEEIFKLAFEEIGNRTSLLNGYELHVIAKDTQGKPGLAAKMLYELIYEPPTKIALLGPPLSDPFVTTATITPFFNLLQVGYIAKTSSVMEQSDYPTRFMINYIEDDLNALRIKLMDTFGWKKVATLAYNEDIFISQINELHELLVHNYTLLTSAIVTDIDQTEDHIKRLKQYDARIIFGAIRSSKAPKVFCEVYKQGLYGGRYAWILTGSSMYENWIANIKEEDLPCPRQHLYTAANRMLTLNQKRLSLSLNQTFSGWTPADYENWMKSVVAQYPELLLSRSHPFAYDAAWALAIGLNNSRKYLGNKMLEEFNYNDSSIFNDIERGMSEVGFQGVSGPVSFNEGRRVGISYVELNIGDDRRDVGQFFPGSEIQWFVNPRSLFEGNTVPKDSFTYVTQSLQYSKASLVIVLILSTLGFAVAIACLAFNVYYRNNKNIKMSSPRINNVIIAGTMLIYVAVILASIDYVGSSKSFSEAYCMVSVWTVSIGFTMSFGALFSKTWRVHVLFRKDDIRRKSIRDTQLFGVVTGLVLIDILVLLPWNIINPLKVKLIETKSEDTAKDVILTETTSICDHELKIYWLAAQYVYKGLLLAFGAFIAWETRHIQIPSINDSKYIGFCVYNVVVVCMLYVPVHTFLSPEDVTLKYVLSSCIIVFATTLVLCILFIPKLKLRNATENIKFVPSLHSKTNENSTVISNGTTMTKIKGELNISPFEKGDNANGHCTDSENSKKIRVSSGKSIHSERKVMLLRVRRPSSASEICQSPPSFNKDPPLDHEGEEDGRNGHCKMSSTFV